MGLNDEFFTVDGDQGEEETPKIHIEAFKPTNQGDVPELKDDIEFIAPTQEEDSLVTNDDVQLNSALEQACVKLRDIELFSQRLREEGGISQSIALESLDVLPRLITEQHPKEFYTKSISRTCLSYALEEQEQEKKSAFSTIIQTIQAYLTKVRNWFSNFFARFNFKKKKEEVAKKKQEWEKEKEAMEQKVAAMTEEMEQFKRAAQASTEEFEKELEKAKQATQAAEQKVSVLSDLPSQMRILDETKNREIAQLLDEIDKLRRREESSRSARLEILDKDNALKIVVFKNMCLDAFEVVDKQQKEIFNDYNETCLKAVLDNFLVSRYLFGNGVQNRLQTIKRMQTALETIAPISKHFDDLVKAFQDIQKQPGQLMTVIENFDFHQLQSPKEVFQKISDYGVTAAQFPANKLSIALKEMAQASADASNKLENVNFEEVVKSLNELFQQLSTKSIDTRQPNTTEIAKTYRALQIHISNLMNYVMQAMHAQAELIMLTKDCINLEPSIAKYVQTQSARTRIQSICNEVAKDISLVPSFVQNHMRQMVSKIILYTLSRQSA